MSKSSTNHFQLRHWTVLTWLAVLSWLWEPLIPNYPSFQTYTIDGVTGELVPGNRYNRLAELPYPVGWPIYYVRPAYLSQMAEPIIAGAPLPPPPPSSVHPFAIVANFVLIAVAIWSLIYVLQTTKRRISIMFLLGVMAAVPCYFVIGRLIAYFAGYAAARWYPIAVYYSPIPAALAVRFSIFSRVAWLRRTWMRMRSSQEMSGYTNADDVLAAASKLEIRGDWIASLDLYRSVADCWPEHAEYVQHCIDRVTEKQCLAQT